LHGQQAYFFPIFPDNSVPYCNEGIRLRPTVARYAVTSKSPVYLTETILLAEKIHAALVSLSNASSVFTGCDKLGKPMQGNIHAHVFCESNKGLGKGNGGEITHTTIYAPMGFEPNDQKALEDLSEVWGENGLEIYVILLGLGQPQDFGGPDHGNAQCPLLSKSQIWVSRTPFLPTRYPKVTRAGAAKVDAAGLQIGSPEHEIRRLLKLEHLPEPILADPIPYTIVGQLQTGWSSFRRLRCSGRGRRAGNCGYGFRIEFSQPVQGPIAIGYGAHFGLGLFVPLDEHCIQDMQCNKRE
jgi:CRISPR-associated protein Csb2